MSEWKHCEGCTDLNGCEAHGCLKALTANCGQCQSFKKPACPRGGGYESDEICDTFITSPDSTEGTGQ